MRKHFIICAILVASSLIPFSCKKNLSREERQQYEISSSNANAETPPFNLEVILRGSDKGFGLVKFRQAVDPSKIITLDTWVRNLESNHHYLLQRAVDPINAVDGDCTSKAWLTLGKGLTPHSIPTDASGAGREQLWRDITAIPTGSMFDIHFRLIDAMSMAEVLTSSCYQYVVR